VSRLTSAEDGFIQHFMKLVRAMKILLKDNRVPRPLRGAAAFGALPIPGPFDEAVLLTVAFIMLVFYPHTLREAWGEA